MNEPMGKIEAIIYNFCCVVMYNYVILALNMIV